MADIEGDAVETPPCCSFCDKGEAEVGKLIAGHSAFICDECVGRCLAVVGARQAKDAGADGLEMTAFALNQVRRPRPPPDTDNILKCDFCAKQGAEIGHLNAGHAGWICGDCVELLLEMRAWSDPAYRAHVIELLNGLADQPAPPPEPSLD